MKRISKPVFFIVAILIIAFACTAFVGIKYYDGDIQKTSIKGISDIRWGIDIRGGVEATFKPAEDIDATDEQLDSAKSIIETRMVSNGITDYEIYADYGSDRIIVRFPWKEDDTDFDPVKAVDELAATASLTFRNPSGETVMDGSAVASASVGVDTSKSTQGEYVVQLELNSEGAQTFADITSQLQLSSTLFYGAIDRCYVLRLDPEHRPEPVFRVFHRRGHLRSRIRPPGEGNEAEVDPPLDRGGRHRPDIAVPGHLIDLVEGEESAVCLPVRRECFRDGRGDVLFVVVPAVGVIPARAVVVVGGGFEDRPGEHHAVCVPGGPVEPELLELGLRHDLRQDGLEDRGHGDPVDQAVIREPFAEGSVEAGIGPPVSEPDPGKKLRASLRRDPVRQIEDLVDI